MENTLVNQNSKFQNSKIQNSRVESEALSKGHGVRVQFDDLTNQLAIDTN